MIISYHTWNNKLILFSCKKIKSLFHTVFELILVLNIYKKWSVNGVFLVFTTSGGTMFINSVNELADVSLWA